MAPPAAGVMVNAAVKFAWLSEPPAVVSVKSPATLTPKSASAWMCALASFERVTVISPDRSNWKTRSPLTVAVALTPWPLT